MGTAKLDQLVDLLTGNPFKSDRFTADPDDVCLVKGENVGQGEILWDISKRWPAEDWSKLEKFQLLPGDVVVAMDRPWIPAGLKWASIRAGDPPSLLVQRVARLRSASPLLRQGFIRCLIGSPAFENYVRPITSGVNVPHLSGKQILDFEFRLPSVAEQDQIVNLISAYDDFIENNLRRIRILEEMARVLYGEWFVELMAPGVSAIGDDVPTGWRFVRLATIADVNRAQINTKAPPDRILYIDISSVGPGIIREVSELAFTEAPGRARRIVQHGDILWSCVRPNRRSHALVLSPEPDTVASTGFAVLTATKVPFTFLYQATTTDNVVAYLTNHATGAAYPAVTAKTFEDAEILLPPTDLLERFAQVTTPMAELIANLQRENLNLRATRDLLLPRVMSGQLCFADVDDLARTATTIEDTAAL